MGVRPRPPRRGASPAHRHRRRPRLAIPQPWSGRRVHRPQLPGGRGAARGPGAGPGVLPEANRRRPARNTGTSTWIRSFRTSWRRARPRPFRAARRRPLGETARAKTTAYGTGRRRHRECCGGGVGPYASGCPACASGCAACGRPRPGTPGRPAASTGRSEVRPTRVRWARLSLPSASIGGRPPDPQARERNVLITHDTRCALDTVVDLVNTAPEDDAAADGLPDFPALADFVRNH